MSEKKPIEFFPIDDQVVFTRLPKDEMSTGGIHLPEKRDGMNIRGSVVAVGPGRILESGERGAMSVKIGDVILVAKAGRLVELDGVRYFVVRERDEILAKEVE